MTMHDDKLDTPIAICGVRFDHATYYEDGELLYLTKGVPLGAADGDTPEGHTVLARAGGPTTRLSREVLEPLLVERAVRD